MPGSFRSNYSSKSAVGQKPSGTALAAAALRAMAANDEAIRGPDYLAEIFLPEKTRSALKQSPQENFRVRSIPGMYEFMIARTAFFDGLVEGAFRAGLPQVVFLGAGYDTRPYRFRDLIQQSRVFELDAAPTQQRKMAILAARGINKPESLFYVPVDFTTDVFTDNLIQAGFDAGLETLFIWEGVTYYLPAAAVDTTLKLIKSASPGGSTVVFDYASISPESADNENVRRMRDAMKSRYAGEPVRFWIKESAIEDFLASRGFETARHLTSVEMEKEYLKGLKLEDGIPSVFCLAHARVRGAE